MRTITLVRLALVVCLVVGSGFGVSGQESANTPPSNMRIVVLGGFLGWVDGLVLKDDITKALGGLYSVQEWLTKQEALAPGKSSFTRGRDLLVFAGNNRPLDAPSTTDADKRFAAMKPDAVAVSVDDFLRSLQTENSAGAFAARLASPNEPPYVVSNGFIKIRKKGLNKIKDAGIELEIPDDESVGWVSKLSASCSDCPDTSSMITLTDENTPPSPPITVEITPEDGHVTFAFKPYLHPGAKYRLVLRSRRQTRDLRFVTHAALTTARKPVNGSVPPELQGLPLQRVERKIGADVASVIVLGMVNPEIKAQLGVENWKWSEKTSPKSHCDGDECEIGFMSASDAFKAVHSYQPEKDPHGHPFYVAVSGLSDRQTSTLITDTPQLRVVVLDPDASSLGQDVGDSAVIRRSAAKTPTTQVWTRPHWIGSKAGMFHGTLAWKEPHWEIETPLVTADEIPGEKVRWDVTGSHVLVQPRRRASSRAGKRPLRHLPDQHHERAQGPHRRRPVGHARGERRDAARCHPEVDQFRCRDPAQQCRGPADR